MIFYLDSRGLYTSSKRILYSPSTHQLINSSVMSLLESLPKAILEFCLSPLYDNSSSSSMRQCSRKLLSIERSHVWNQPVSLTTFNPSNTSGCPKILKIENFEDRKCLSKISITKLASSTTN